MNLVIQAVLIVIFFTIFGPGLAYVGIAYLIGAIIASIISIIFAKKICPELKTSLSSFDRTRVTEICNMGGWVIINQIGSLLFLQIDLIVVNLFFGAVSAGEYAIALQWVILLRAIATMLSSVLTPIVLSYYALEKTDSLIKISPSAVKLLGLAMALPIGLVCGFAPELLTFWVGPQFSMLAPLMIILTAHLAVNLAVLPLFSINVAYNKVSIPGIITLIMGIGNFLLASILSLYSGLGYYGVALAGAIVLSLKNAFFTPWYATRILNINSHTFSRSIVPGVVSTILVGILSAGLTLLFPIGTIISLVIAGSLVSLIYLISVWMLGLSVSERTLFSNHLPEKIRRFMNEIPCYCTNR
jgi:membrane protein EpsK